VSVVHVGEPGVLEAADDLDVTTVAADRLPEVAAEADCIVVEEPGDGLDALAPIGDVAVPTVLFDRAGDPATAARATRLGVDEYVTDGALDGETLADRVRSVAGGDNARAAGALESLHAVATDRSLSLDAKIDRLLDVGRERLGLELGFLSALEDDEFRFVAVRGDHPVVETGASLPTSETYFRRTVDAEGLVALHDVDDAGGGTDADSEATGLRCYLGGRVTVDDEVYGALCFASDEPRTREFSSRERRFVDLLIEWLGYELERDRHERTLRRYKAVHETVEGMVFVVGEGTTVELVTEPLLERFGYDRGTLVGQPITAFLGEGSVEAGYEAFAELQDGADSVTLETDIETADGEVVPVAVDLTLLSPSTEFEGLVGVVHDRTALSETRADLEAERDRFQSLFDQLPDAVVDVAFVDGEPIVRAVNPAFEDVFGYDAASVVDESVNELLVPEDHREEARRIDRDSTTDGDTVAEVERLTADGLRTFLFRGFVYATEGDTDRAFGIYTDVTDRLEQERRLRVLHRVLRHNLRNEMTGIIGFAELLGDRIDDPDDREYAELIRRHAEDVAKLGEQVQRIERALDRDRRRAPVDPVAVVASVAETIRERHPAATIHVPASDGDGYDDDDAVHVVADELLEFAVENLLQNAVEHHEGTPTVTVDVRIVEDRWVDLTVRDDGPGIPERERAVVGGDREITQLDHSRGLGLWVTRWIVEGVGGELRFEDCEDGAAVTLRLQYLSEASTE
jgi:PAS domain S-box-containing protein